MKINIALCCDDNYVMPTLTCLTSIFENNKSHCFVVYILSGGVTKENELRFQSLAEFYNQRIVIETIDTSVLSTLPLHGRYVNVTYYRFIIPQIIPDSKVLYLDGDIIVTSDIGSLWQTEIDNYACAVVEDQRCDEVQLFNRFYLESTYFNAGVLLINCDYWRKNNIPEQLIFYTKENSKLLVHNDQDALNVILSGRTKYVPFTYNFQDRWYGDIYANTAHFKKWGELEEAKLAPVVIHFGTKEKPWYKECKHPLKERWRYYANLHEFIGFRETRLYSFRSRLLHKLVYGVGMKLIKKFG